MLTHIVPLIIVFFLGYGLKRIRLFDRNAADVFLRLVFYVSLPALLVISVARIELKMEFLLLPLTAGIVIFFTYSAALLAGKAIRLKTEAMGVFLVGSMIMNMAFIYPFVIAGYGDEGFARASMFDLGNGIVSLTFVYLIACKHGEGGKSSALTKRILFSPPIWGLLIGIALNLLKIYPPAIITNTLLMIGGIMIPLILLALGIYLEFNFKGILPVIAAVIVRSGIGLAAGVILSHIFGFEGITRNVVIIASAAPAGFNTLTFSALENLDKDFAAKFVSLSTLAGLIIIPGLILLMKY